ncbi:MULTISPECIES: photosynthetic reaction center subunit H [unclassified Roseivivax]|uniref:photosynthetic reaction center subunit H n=1 Tax=Roseivivax sp. GX 12232 TaxID=2900547 RepID=UPI001E481880|nr:photosynthetic reaction center subunit H [Roseivivax sp. GX 12232]MCE0506238.1 photosynthetic reaction center subunit H [Roseivivax sp. GX 12232]
MVDDYIFGNLDLASISLWLFFIFFVGLVIWIQRENQREGYPLVDEDGSPADAGGVFPMPADKTFVLPHGRGTYTVPSGQPADRDDHHANMTRAFESGGFPYDPTGNPFEQGIGPAAWANRRDEPELDGHGRPKIIPMKRDGHFLVAAGNDPRGLPVRSGDGQVVGMVSDMWIDEPEQLVRYLEIELEGGGGTRLLPMTLARIWGNRVDVKTLYAAQFPGVPTTKAPDVVTKLEEDKISAYYGGGVLYASQKRQDPQL